jgi:hypothetical protein
MGVASWCLGRGQCVQGLEYLLAFLLYAVKYGSNCENDAYPSIRRAIKDETAHSTALELGLALSVFWSDEKVIHNSYYLFHNVGSWWECEDSSEHIALLEGLENELRGDDKVMSCPSNCPEEVRILFLRRFGDVPSGQANYQPTL